MTEQELREKYVGGYVTKQSGKWAAKREVYKETGVWSSYVEWDRYYRGQFTDATGFVDVQLKRQSAQHKIDTFLIRKSHGEDIAMPVPPNNPVDKKKETGPVDPLVDFSVLPENDTPVEWAKAMTWIYRNMGRVVKVEDAPSAGEYSHLIRLQNDVTAKNDFYKTVVPRLFPSKTQLDNEDRFHDDGRKHFELFDKLSAESNDGQSEVSVL